MATGVKLEPDAYLIKFYPMNKSHMCRQDEKFDSDTLRYMKMNQVKDKVRRTVFEQRIKGWLKSYIGTNNDVVITVAPGHKANDTSSFMYTLIKDFITENKDLKVINGCALLVRETEIPKQATSGGNRSEKTHHDSIKVANTLGLLIAKGKTVIILDDVWTSGCTLRVCEEKINTIGPKDVKLLAIGKTV